jgi:hypothetical protein
MHHDLGDVPLTRSWRRLKSLPGRVPDGIYAVPRTGHADPSRIYTLCRSPFGRALGPSTTEMEEGQTRLLQNPLPAVWRLRCRSIMHISLARTADSSGRCRWIVPTMTPPSSQPVVSSTGTMWSFGKWIDLSSGSMPRQNRYSKIQRSHAAQPHDEAGGCSDGRSRRMQFHNCEIGLSKGPRARRGSLRSKCPPVTP